jgi:hypothetical protein
MLTIDVANVEVIDVDRPLSMSFLFVVLIGVSEAPLRY